MRCIRKCIALPVLGFMVLLLTSCYSTSHLSSQDRPKSQPVKQPTNVASYESRLPSRINTGEKTILVDPTVHAWGAYNADGSLEKAGLAVAGADWCPDIGRRCHTGTGTFRINSLGSPGCKSTLYPKPRGGAPMPYCMFFNKNQALHGVHENELAEANLSHGCVRLHTYDAEWIRYNFAGVGTKVIVKPY